MQIKKSVFERSYMKSKKKIIIPIVIFAVLLIAAIAVGLISYFGKETDEGAKYGLTYDKVTDEAKGSYYVVSGCSSDASAIIIPSSYKGIPVLGIAAYAFSDNTTLTSVSLGSVETIGQGAFQYCTSLNSVSIPGTVTTIGESAFEGCYCLETVEMSEGLSTIGTNAFKNCYTLNEINLPTTLSIIDYGAFAHCMWLESIELPENLTHLGSEAFRRCISLTSVTIPGGILRVNYGTFAECSSLSTLTLSEGLYEIWVSAFFGCSALESVVLPESMRTVASGAFESCTSLKRVYVPSGVTALLDDVFFECSALEEISVSEGNEAYKSIDGVLYTADGLTLIYYPAGKSDVSFTVPDGVTEIGMFAFYGSSLEEVIFPDSLLLISRYAFKYNVNLTKLVIPDSVTSIGKYAFFQCRSISSVTIGKSVAEIGTGVFLGCTIAEVYYNGTEESWNEISIGVFNDSLNEASFTFAE